jgi:carboxymethylenebutenolidase
MGEMVRIKSNAADGFEFDAYRARPSGRRLGGVVVIQEIFGLDEHVLRDVDRWADLGFEAIAPSLYDRREPGFVSRHDQAGMAAGIGHARNTDLDVALADIAACRDQMEGPVFVVGYCYGGSLAWLTASKLPGFSGASCYYGSMIAANATLVPRCPTIVHLGRLDAGIPADEVRDAVKAANPNVEVYIYDEAGHGFNNEDPERWHEASAVLARQRTLALFGVA